MNPRIFSGIYPAGIVYADRKVERGGDYARLAFLPFDTLVPEFDKRCPKVLRPEIEADIARLQSMRGQSYQVSSSGQSVILGSKA